MLVRAEPEPDQSVNLTQEENVAEKTAEEEEEKKTEEGEESKTVEDAATENKGESLIDA